MLPLGEKVQVQYGNQKRLFSPNLYYSILLELFYFTITVSNFQQWLLYKQ